MRQEPDRERHHCSCVALQVVPSGLSEDKPVGIHDTGAREDVDGSFDCCVTGGEKRIFGVVDHASAPRLH
ncbi:MAG: hypothetical protein F4235_02620 [Candidatus Dadabacteria bacterium]|nr:hypothetical protein [Candidatus Dadabacteria bacterium]